MTKSSEKIPGPKEIEKEIGDFLSKRFGGDIKIVTPQLSPWEASADSGSDTSDSKQSIKFDMKPEELVDYLDQYIVRQDAAKEILATKICTHFNRIEHARRFPDEEEDMVGRIKNNVLMIGPTGVGKTYMVKLIARKLGVPFVKGDATKFSETGYVGGDVEDLVRDLLDEADDDIELAQHGIIYIDEIDKIASSRNFIGADISRTGVQRALLKPMEETNVDLKVSHDPISMIQEIERFRKTGKRDKRSVNTKNILFIMSGAFGDLSDIVRRRLTKQKIGFGADIRSDLGDADYLRRVKAEDLIAYGFESEFVGRLPVFAVFEPLNEEDLFEILKNPNNPLILGKKLDFAAYGIDVKFEEAFLQKIARIAAEEQTGARGLVGAMERAMIRFEKKLPSMNVRYFSMTTENMENADSYLEKVKSGGEPKSMKETFNRLSSAERSRIRDYVDENAPQLSKKFGFTLTPARIDAVAAYYAKNAVDINRVIRRIRKYTEEIKKIELYFYKNHGINIVLEEDAIDYMVERIVHNDNTIDQFFNELSESFEHGLKLVREKSGKNRFFITRAALESPETFVAGLIRDNYSSDDETSEIETPKEMNP